MKAEKTPFWVLLGPALLLATVVLLFCKTALLLGRPVWMVGLSISILLACGISYLAFQELRNREQNLNENQAKKGKEAEDMRSILDETHLLYRDKISKLEETFSSFEKEQKDLLTEKENAYEELQKGYEHLFEQSTHNKNQASSFQTALEDALDELRNLRQVTYLDQDREKKLPKDLMNQYLQLREQFEEKSAVLEQTRRRLFTTEGYLEAFKKERGLEMLEPSQEVEILSHHIDELLEENHILNGEIAILEKLIHPPKKTQTKPKKKLEKMLEFQFENSND